MVEPDTPFFEHQSPRQRRWYWPLYPLTFAASASALVALVLVTFLASVVCRPECIPGPFGTYYRLDAEYQHGWPLCYARRDVRRSLETPVNGDFTEPLSAWRPWQGLREFRLFALLVDTGTAVVVIFLAGAGVQWWRSRRIRWWQWHLRDLFGLTALVGVACAWAAARQLENRREAELVSALEQEMPLRLSDGNFAHKDVAVPGFLPVNVARAYRRSFERVVSVQTERHTDLACQFPNLVILKTWEIPSDFKTHVTKMPKLEVLDLDGATLHRQDISSNFTVVRDLPPLPNLRIVNFRLTSVEDADLVWLARCPRLEVIVLSFTRVGGGGVRHLCQLKNLRVLAIASDGLTDDGCRVLSRIDSLEDLTIVSSNVRDDGILQLARLTNLKRLCLRTAASEESVAKLREQLLRCNVDAASAPPK